MAVTVYPGGLHWIKITRSAFEMLSIWNVENHGRGITGQIELDKDYVAIEVTDDILARMKALDDDPSVAILKAIELNDPE